MRYHVDEVSLHRDTGSLYLSLSFWLTEAGRLAGNPPVLSNDFVIQLPPASAQQPISDGNGNFQGVDGLWYPMAGDPPAGGWATTTVVIDRRAYVVSVVVGFVKQAVANRWSGDMTDQRIVRTQTDQNGVLAALGSLAGTVGTA